MIGSLFVFLLSPLILAEVPVGPHVVVREQDIRPLPGQLNTIPVFNSNSPEIVLKEGILLSTFPPPGKLHPEAHLNYAFEGRFDLFGHHIAKPDPPYDLRTLYWGVLLNNPTSETVTVDLLQGASYLTQPDAPFVYLTDWIKDSTGWVYAGPGSRVMGHILRGYTEPEFPVQVELQPRQSRMLLNLPIPIRGIGTNGRSTLLRLRSDGPVYVASLAMFAKPMEVLVEEMQPLENPSDAEDSEDLDQTLKQSEDTGDDLDGSEDLEHDLESLEHSDERSEPFSEHSLDATPPDTPHVVVIERAPTVEEWQELLRTADLSGPRDLAPTPLAMTEGQVIYGRVAGVAQGSQWKTELTDPGSPDLAIPDPGSAFSYGISLLHEGTLGTGQIQSGKMLVRYPDTAYQAHGNYGVEYNLILPLTNYTDETQTVAIALETPIKEDELSQPGLQFFDPPPERIFFRGVVRVRFTDDVGFARTQYIHLVLRRGQQGEPLVWLEMPPGDHRLVEVDLLYPPDSTPPQVLTVKTLKKVEDVEDPEPIEGPEAVEVEIQEPEPIEVLDSDPTLQE